MNLKRKIKEELNRTLLKENCVASVIWEGEVLCACGCEGYLGVVQWSNCSIHNNLDCPCSEPCDTGGRTGGSREPMGTTMAESRGYRSHRTRR